MEKRQRSGGGGGLSGQAASEGLRCLGAVSCRDTGSTGAGRERSALQHAVSGWGARLKTRVRRRQRRASAELQSDLGRC